MRPHVVMIATTGRGATIEIMDRAATIEIMGQCLTMVQGLTIMTTNKWKINYPSTAGAVVRGRRENMGQ